MKSDLFKLIVCIASFAALCVFAVWAEMSNYWLPWGGGS